jgi:type I restriction enzyme S subunit
VRRVQIRKVARLGTGHTPSRSVEAYWDPAECTLPWLTLADVWQLRDGSVSVIHDTKEMISPLGLANSAAVRHPAGTVAFSRTASVGFSCILGVDMATSQDFVTWTCGPQLDPRYLLWVLRGERVDILRRTQGSTHKTIYMPDIEQLTIPLPPLEHQGRIVEYLDAETVRIDEVVKLKRRLSDVVRGRLWRSIASSLSGQEVEIRRCILPPIGGSWGTEPGTAEIDCRCIRAADFDFDRLRALPSAPIRSYSIREIRSRLLSPGDLVIEKSGGGERQPVGRVIVWDGSAPAVPTNFAARLRPAPGYDGAYLGFAIASAYHLRRTTPWVNQTTGIQNLDLGGFLTERVPVPSHETQVAMAATFTSVLERTRDVIEKLDHQIALLQEHRVSLIASAVAPEIRAA